MSDEFREHNFCHEKFVLTAFNKLFLNAVGETLNKSWVVFLFARISSSNFLPISMKIDLIFNIFLKFLLNGKVRMDRND